MKLETSAAEATAADANYAYADYDARPDPDHRPMYLGPTLKAINSISAKGAVLDAGCGGGLFSVGLHKAGYDVFGMDLSPSGIRAAKQRNVGHFEIASLYEDLTAPFDVSSFDAIITIEVIEHLYSPTRFAECAYSALRPGGLLVVSTPLLGLFQKYSLGGHQSDGQVTDGPLGRRAHQAFLTKNLDAPDGKSGIRGRILHWHRRGLARLCSGLVERDADVVP